MKVKRTMLRTLRVILAVAFFAMINLFVLGFADAFGWTARIQIVPAVFALNVAVLGAWTLLTLLLGRVFCSVACPFGLLQDAVLFLRRGVFRMSFRNRPRRIALRVLFAASFVGLSAAGFVSLAGIIDPYSSYGRVAAHVFGPAARALCGWTARLAERFGCDCLVMAEQTAPTCHVAAFVLAAATLLAIVLAAAWRGRIFCNTVCPVGTALAALSVRPFLRVKIDAAKCVRCGMCERRCRAECVDAKSGAIDQSRCVRCLECLAVCGKDAISWK